MSITRISRAELLAENEALRFRLEEAEDTLHAIKSGGVDALVVSSPDGEQVFTLQGADHSYRLLVESMNEGAAILTPEGTIVYCNNRLATMLHVPIEKLIGSALASHVDPADCQLLAGLLGGMRQNNENEEISLLSGAETRIPVLISCAAVDVSDNHAVSVVFTDISVRKSWETSVQERSAELSLINTQLKQEIALRTTVEAKLRDSQERLRNLYANLLEIREEERKTISRDIHEELGQVLATVQMGLSLLSTEYQDQENTMIRSTKLELLLRSAIKTVQRISSQLRPMMLEVLGLAESMEWQARDFQARAGIPCKIVVLLREKNIEESIATTLYRIFQESLSNVVRHSGATQVEAYLVEKNRLFFLLVRDNGKGITQEHKNNPQSLGLIGIQERANYLGGRVRIISSAQRGTVIAVRIPFKKAAAP